MKALRAWFKFWFRVWQERRHGVPMEVRHLVDPVQARTRLLVMHSRTLERLVRSGSIIRSPFKDDPVPGMTLTGIMVQTNDLMPEWAERRLTDELGNVIGGPRG